MATRFAPLIVSALAVAVGGCAHATSAGSGSTAPGASDAAALAAARAGSRPIGGAPRFDPPAPRARVTGCSAARGPRYGAHLELFAANRVVLIPAGVGTQPPRAVSEGRITGAACYGAVVTVDATGLLLVRPGSGARLRDLFSEWRAKFGRAGFLSFKGPLRAYVGGRRRGGDPGAIPLTRHAVIVIEAGQFVPPHTHYAFPPGT